MTSRVQGDIDFLFCGAVIATLVVYGVAAAWISQFTAIAILLIFAVILLALFLAVHRPKRQDEYPMGEVPLDDVPALRASKGNQSAGEIVTSTQHDTTSYKNKIERFRISIWTYRKNIYAVTATAILLLIFTKSFLGPAFRLFGVEGVVQPSVALLSLVAALVLPFSLLALLEQAARLELTAPENRAHAERLGTALKRTMLTGWLANPGGAAQHSSVDAADDAAQGWGPEDSRVTDRQIVADSPETDEQFGLETEPVGEPRGIISPVHSRRLIIFACVSMLSVASLTLLASWLSNSSSPRVALALGDGFTVKRNVISYHPGTDITRRLILRHFNKIDQYSNSSAMALQQDQYLDALILAYVNGSVPGMASVSRKLSAPANRNLWTIERKASGMPTMIPESGYKRTIEYHILLLDNTLLLEAFLYETLGNVEAARSRYIQYYEIVKTLSIYDAREPNAVGILPRLWLAKAKLVALDALPNTANENSDINKFMRPLFISNSHFLLKQYHALAVQGSECQVTEIDCRPRFVPGKSPELDALEDFAQLHLKIYALPIFAPLRPQDSLLPYPGCCGSTDPSYEKIDDLEKNVRRLNVVLAPFLDDVMLMKLEVLRQELSENRTPKNKRRYCEALQRAGPFRDTTPEQFDGLDILRAYLDEGDKACSNGLA